MTNDLTLSVENVDFQPTFINQKSREVQFSMIIENSFKIPNIIISFEEDLKQNWPWAPVQISRNKELFPYLEDLVSERLLTDKKLINPLKNLLEEEIDILPFGMVSKKIDKATLIPIDCIEIDDIGFCKDLFIQRIGLGHYLTFYNQWLCNVDGKFILDSERCLIKNAKVVSVINELLCVKNFQERANQAFKQKRSKFFYLGVEFKHQKSPLVFS